MRQIVLDTETTGLNARAGDRIIEIGCVEIANRRLTGRRLHCYVNPERNSDPEALKIHGITTEFLADKPKFDGIVDELLAFVGDADVVIHNASFDVGFLDEELARLRRPRFVEHCSRVTDTLELSKQLNPGKRHSLDALCERYGVSNSHRTLHGALLDAELLAEVYLAMTRGQDSLVIELEEAQGLAAARSDFSGLELLVLKAGIQEIADHERVLDGIEKESKGRPVWRMLEATGDPI